MKRRLPPPRSQEKASDYFNFDEFPLLRDRKVTRAELLFWLTNHFTVMEQQRPWRRFVRWLRRYYAKSATAPITPETQDDARE